MATIKNKSLEEIENKIQAIEEDSQRLKKKLKITSKERLKRFISMIRKENTQYKLDKKTIKGQIKSNKDTINELETMVDNLATFDFDIATQFLTKAISIIEQEDYQKIDYKLKRTNISLSTRVSTGIITPIAIPKTNYECLTLITSPKNAAIIHNMYDEDEIDCSVDIEFALDEEDGKYILLESSDTYTMFDSEDWQVPEELTSNYPYLEEIIPGLIDLKLENNNLSDKQIASLMLKKIPQRYSHLVKKRESIEKVV